MRCLKCRGKNTREVTEVVSSNYKYNIYWCYDCNKAFSKYKEYGKPTIYSHKRR